MCSVVILGINSYIYNLLLVVIYLRLEIYKCGLLGTLIILKFQILFFLVVLVMIAVRQVITKFQFLGNNSSNISFFFIFCLDERFSSVHKWGRAPRKKFWMSKYTF